MSNVIKKEILSAKKRVHYAKYLIASYGDYPDSRKIIFPKKITANNIDGFLSKCQVLFSVLKKEEFGYEVVFSDVKGIDILGTLLIFKFFEFSVINKCFALPIVDFNEYVEAKIIEFGFLELINAYMSSMDEKTERIEQERKIKELSVKLEDNFFIAPQPLIRRSNFTNEFLRGKVLPALRDYYKDHKDHNDIIAMISICFSEVSLNFWEHAIEDTQSVMVANGNKEFVEIACTDTGNGILTTLKESGMYEDVEEIDIFRSCISQGVTSKRNTDHMGFGLWMIDELISEVKGKLYIYSEGYKYINDNNKKSVEKCSFWKGTIIYLLLPLKVIKTIKDIEAFKAYLDQQTDVIQINYG